MIVPRKPLSRRRFLKSAGYSVALPLLDAMIPSRSNSAIAATVSPTRFGIVYIPMGMTPGPWTPAGDGAIADLSPSLTALMPVLDKVTVLTNLRNKPAYPDGAGGGHATASSAFLNASHVKRTEGSDYGVSTTIDQIAARQIGVDTALPSLELGTEVFPPFGNCDNGFACTYLTSLSWSSPTTPLPLEPQPRVAFERMFGDGGPAKTRRAELGKDASILDWVLEDMRRLQREVGPRDRNRVNEYLDSVREVERRIQKAEQQAAGSPLSDLDRPAGVPGIWEDHVKLMFDLQLLALQADVTRVIKFQMARELSGRTYPSIGVPDPHHGLSHHRNDPESLARLAKINAYHVSLFAYFLEKLRATPDGDGSLLDHSVYLLGSGMGNPDVHDHENLPLVLIDGSQNGGRHIRYREPRPLASLLLTVLRKVGVRLESVGDSTGTLEELM